MKLNEISIKNIKSFKSEVVIDFDKNLNILIGPNAGGKSNLLSTITIVLNHYFYKQLNTTFENSPNNKPVEKIQDKQLFGDISRMLEKYIGDGSESTICIKMQSENTDYENMKLLSERKAALTERIREFKSGYDLNYPDNWFEHFKNKQDLEYKINNHSLVNHVAGSPEALFLYYLNKYHAFRWFTDSMESIELYSPIIFFPPSRALQGNFIIDYQSLRQVDYFNRLSNISQLQSRSTNASLAEIAVSHFGRKMRIYEKKAAKIRGKTTDDLFNEDNEAKLLTKYLNKIGYDWKIVEEETLSRYKLLLTKGNSEFDIAKASSGEQEILNFLIGIFSLNVQGGVVIIDEPELHLHPKWQLLLLEIITDLSSSKNNQFIVSTHSPTFVNSTTYNYIVRVYKNNENESRIVVLKDAEPFELRDILHIINGTNNEKMFFADVVVLVEGITDRLVFNKIFNELLGAERTSKIIEVIEVNGKSNFKKFKKFLDNLKIPNFFISDLDYLNEIGTTEIKALFQVNKNKIAKDVLCNKKSKDGKALVDVLEKAINDSNTDSLKDIWDYIKNFRRELKPNLTPKEEALLSEFLEAKKGENIFVLRNGDIEDYFMDGFKSKDLDNVISLLKDENFNSWEKDKTSGFGKLKVIAEEILNKII